MNIQIIENFLPKSLFSIIQSNLTSEYFPWYFNNTVSSPDKINSNFQFTHSFYKNNEIQSNKFEIVHPIIYLVEEKLKVDILHVLRIKSNLMVPIVNYKEGSEAHTDENQDDVKIKSLLLYVNDSDGETLIFNNDGSEIIQRIKPKANTAIWFDSNILHSSSPPKNTKNRIVVNFVFVIKNEI